MGLHDGHRQRSKRRYLALGAEGMEDHQLLELLLFYAIPRQDTNETAHRLIQRFGSLQGVLHAAPEELTSVEGVGEKRRRAGAAGRRHGPAGPVLVPAPEGAELP